MYALGNGLARRRHWLFINILWRWRRFNGGDRLNPLCNVAKRFGHGKRGPHQQQAKYDPTATDK
jgi:hypothetical protein